MDASSKMSSKIHSQNIKYALCKTVESFNGKRKLTINGSNWRIFEKKVPPQIPNLARADINNLILIRRGGIMEIIMIGFTLFK